MVSYYTKIIKKIFILFYLGSDDYILELGATTHLNMNKDIELALRFTTGIKNGDEFFTDLNGFQVIRCKNIPFDNIYIR
jgi:hypothetical protein